MKVLATYNLALMVLLALLASGSKPSIPPFKVPKGWPKPVYQFSENPVTTAGVQLGRALFYDPILSADSSTSCSSCHSPYNAFAHTDHTLSHGIDGREGRRNAPALFNLAWQPLFMRDGAARHLDMQALMPITHPDEMGETLPHLLAKLNKSNYYKQAAFNAWGDSTITSPIMLKSLSQFLLTLVSSTARYDEVMAGKAVFSEPEAKGHLVFKQQCQSCHPEPLFTNHKFERNGLPMDPDLKDLGRYEVTLQTGDSLRFMVPTLRNLEYTYPYMHDGRMRKLGQVLTHYSGKQLVTSTSKQLPAITISPDDRVHLTAFLLTLNDRGFIFNPAHEAPEIRR